MFTAVLEMRNRNGNAPTVGQVAYVAVATHDLAQSKTNTGNIKGLGAQPRTMPLVTSLGLEIILSIETTCALWVK